MSLYPKDQEITVFGENIKYPNMGEDGKFTNGSFSDPKIKPSFIPAETINLILDNLENVIKEAGIESNNQDANQLINAVKKLAGDNVSKFKYKLEEFDTGKTWIDDRIIYGRVFVIENLNTQHFPIEVHTFDDIDKMIDYKIIGVYNYDVVKQLFKDYLIGKDKIPDILALYIENNILYFHCLTNPDLIINNNDNKLEIYVEYIKNNKTLLIINPLSLDLYEDIDSISELQVNTDAETFEARIENQEIASLIIEENKLRVVQKKIGNSNIIIEAQASRKEKASITVPIQIKERPITTLTLSSQSGEVKQDETISITADTNADTIEAQINNSNAQISVSGKTINIIGKNVGSSIITVKAQIPNSLEVSKNYNLNILENIYYNSLIYGKITSNTASWGFNVLTINWTNNNWDWNSNRNNIIIKTYNNNTLLQTIKCNYYVNLYFATALHVDYAYFKKNGEKWMGYQSKLNNINSITDIVIFPV